jgi:hypothetical protein
VIFSIHNTDIGNKSGVDLTVTGRQYREKQKKLLIQAPD